VIIFLERSSLIFPTMAARVVDFPDPVGPVTNTNPLCASTISYITGGRFNSSMLGILVTILLNTAAVPFKVLKKFALNLKSARLIAQSNSLFFSKLATSSGVGLSAILTPRVFSTTSFPLAWMAEDNSPKPFSASVPSKAPNIGIISYPSLVQTLYEASLSSLLHNVLLVWLY
jgi:hypothetical protein